MGGLGDEEIVGFGRGNLAVWMIDDSTYSKRTEKANTTIAFNPSLMRRDQTNNSEMLKMKTSNAIAVRIATRTSMSFAAGQKVIFIHVFP